MPSAVAPDSSSTYTTPINTTTTTTTSPPTSQSPIRPPVSPITPVPRFAQLAPPLQDPTPNHPSHSAPPPPPPPPPPDHSSNSTAAPVTTAPGPDDAFDEENTDAVALRAALHILQLQRDKANHDIRTLRELKSAAATSPDLFLDHLFQGRLRHEQTYADPLRATFELDDLPDDDGSANPSANLDSNSTESRFPQIPSAQNVVRAPPVNWAKYHIVGEPLDRMHEEQRRRPTQGEPGQRAEDVPAPEHFVTAPYDPFRDQLQPMQTRRGSSKPG